MAPPLPPRRRRTVLVVLGSFVLLADLLVVGYRFLVLPWLERHSLKPPSIVTALASHARLPQSWDFLPPRSEFELFVRGAAGLGIVLLVLGLRGSRHEA